MKSIFSSEQKISHADTYSLEAQHAATLIKQERFRREQEQAEKDVPTSVLARAFLRLRRSIADTSTLPTSEEQHEVATLTELLQEHPDIRREFASLVKQLLHTQKPNADGKIVLIDTGTLAWKIRTRAWVDSLLSAVPDASEQQKREIRVSAESYFQLYAATLHARTLERYIQKSLLKHDRVNEDEGAASAARREIEEGLVSHFDLSRMEARHFVSIYVKQTLPTESLNAKIAFLRTMWEKSVADVSGRAMATAAALTVVTSVVDAVVPNRTEAVFKDGAFSLQAYMANVVLGVAKDILEEKNKRAAVQVEEERRESFQRRKVGSMLFRKSEYLDPLDRAQFFEAIEAGDESSRELNRMIVEKVGPTIVGLASALAAMAKLHPVAAVVGFGAMPILGYIEHRSQLAKIEQDKRRRAEEKRALKKFQVYERAYEEVQLSADAGRIVDTIMSAEEDIKKQRSSESATGKVLREKGARYTASLVLGMATELVQRSGMVEGKSLREFTDHMEKVRSGVRDLTNQLHKDLEQSIKKVQDMESALGPQEEYDIPHGARERARISISKLPSFDITLDGVWYGVLHGVSLAIHEGELAHIAGESGSGKSTILKQIAGLSTPAYGEVRIGGVPQYAIRRYGEDSLYQAMAYAGQDARVSPNASVRENLLSLTPSLEVSDDELRSILRELGLEKFTHDLNTPFEHPLSGGERVRFGIAKALVRRPKILLLDEPTGPLDQTTAQEVWRAIDKLHATRPRMTMVVVTHDPIRLQAIKEGGAPRARVIDMDQLHADSEAPPKKP